MDVDETNDNKNKGNKRWYKQPRKFDHHRMNRGLSDLQQLADRMNKLGKALWVKIDSNSLPGHKSEEYRRKVIKFFEEIEKEKERLLK